MKFKQALVGRLLARARDGKTNKRLSSRMRIPRTPGVERVPEEQSRGTQEQVVAVEVMRPSFSCPIPSSSRRGWCCSTEASLVTAVQTHQTTLLFEDRQE